MTTLADLSERELIARIQSHLPPPPVWMTVGIGDDAAVVEPERNRLEVLSVDALVEGVHFDRAFVPPAAIGHRALAVNLSDLAAMGATPRLALLSLALPPTLSLDEFDGLVGGFTALATAHRMHLAGGNLTRSPGPLVADVMVVGTAKRRRTLTRGGARPGDAVYVSGTVGAAGAGLQYLKRAGTAAGPAEPLPAALQACVDRYLYPEARVRLGSLLARNRAATAAIDLSDGLADAAARVAEASGVGLTIEEDAVPIADPVRTELEHGAADPVAAAAVAGDDYELLFTVRRGAAGRLRAVAQASGVTVTRIGVCTARPGALLLARGAAERPMPGPGFHHFR